MSNPYQPSEVEHHAQAYWHENNTFKTNEDLSKEKFYCLSMLPYPSGNLHMGHVRNYTIGDVISRYQRMQGKNVLQPMGWDSFGLPAENAALQRQMPPREWTTKNIKKMRKQFDQLGFAFDWSREISTCEPDYYRWEQWLFLKLYNKGLVYRKNAVVNWDPVDKTVLANEQVVDGKGWRSGAPVERRKIPQWFFKITQYADELLEGLDELSEWPEQVITMQRNWIGRSRGVEISFPLTHNKEALTIYTTRPDTLFGATFMGIAFDHPLAIEASKKSKKIKHFIQSNENTKVAEANIMSQEKKGIFSGFFVKHPLSGETIPVWLTNFVLMEYGTGAIMCVPAHDERDHAFAKQYDLPIRQVIQPKSDNDWDYDSSAYSGHGIIINSGDFNALSSEQAQDSITKALIGKKAGIERTQYRLHDWGISRQRSWGTPIPTIVCAECGIVPVPEEQLPIVLPTELIPTGQGSPLAQDSTFLNTDCPQCGKAAKRETDTMDTFVESSWYYARYCCAGQNKAMLDDCAKYWTPVDQYIGGIEHAVMHLLYARFMHKVLRDEGLLNSNEPFSRLLTQGMVLKNGSKMSKSKGNTVAPVPLIKKFGADTVRLFSMFAAPPEQSLEWSDSGVEGCFRFLKKLWQLAMSVKDSMIALNQHANCTDYPTPEDPNHQKLRKQLHQTLQQANYDYERYQFNTVVSACMIIQNLLVKLNVIIEAEAKIIHEGLSILLRLLSPITPHITHVLWQTLHFGDNILTAMPAKPNAKTLQSDSIELVIQVNGKLRGKITVTTSASKNDIEKAALGHDNIQRFIENKNIRKIVIVPQKLVNIVV